MTIALSLPPLLSATPLFGFPPILSPPPKHRVP
jgi:hypothetical protein